MIDQGTGDVALKPYELVDIDPSTIEILGRKSVASFATRFGDHRASVEPVIGIGDTVVVTIWEASSGGLFSSPAALEKISAGANSATIPEQVVGGDGSITVPYAGRIQVASRTPRAVQAVIEKALEGKAIQPQVLVSVAKPISNTVTIGGEGAATGQRVPLSGSGNRLLDVIASAGGVRSPVSETYVELQRGSETARVSLARVSSEPRENIYMRPRDVVTLVRDPQTFLSYGASGYSGEIPFSADGISLAQAISKSSGLQDNRSDAKGVFVFRYEQPSLLRALRPNSSLASSREKVPVVYRLNLLEPNSLFLEQKFSMQNRDLLYVSNAPVYEISKIVGIFLSPVSQGASIIYTGASAATLR